MATFEFENPQEPTLDDDILELRRLSRDGSATLRDYFSEVYARHGDAPELARWKEVLMPGKLRTFLASHPERNLLPDFNWIMSYSEKYRGEWVAVYAGQLLAHGADYDQVVSEAQSKTGALDFLVFSSW